MIVAPITDIARHRITVDGQGVTTLVCFHGCPLRCRWCINPFSFDPKTKSSVLTAKELYDKVKIDELYFLATNGGVTFGGGEPLLYPEFLREFRVACGNEWHLCAETSLNVPWENVKTAAECIDMFYVDCKDTDPKVYQKYTGKSNVEMLKNLEKLVALVSPERVMVRLPLIKDFNDENARERSQKLLSGMGITQFDRFTYIVK